MRNCRVAVSISDVDADMSVDTMWLVSPSPERNVQLARHVQLDINAIPASKAKSHIVSGRSVDLAKRIVRITVACSTCSKKDVARAIKPLIFGLAPTPNILRLPVDDPPKLFFKPRCLLRSEFIRISRP